ncbi:MAG TPA: anhydro-N-acetylmuramic acid kinase [Nevskia sp.]|nr:anhydro-N-acetylmuramic acid kinase [Nevskia sp.]
MLALGLMSGTSMNGIDAVLAEFRDGRFAGLHASHSLEYPAALRARLLEVARSDAALSLRELATLDVEVAERFADTALNLLNRAGVATGAVTVIGSHGQTVFHDTSAQPWATLQLGDPSLIAARCGIATVGDFRRKDVALGGQGAPLVPAFHHALFATDAEPRCALNLGGIGNLTLLPNADPGQVRGFDTGPANGLLDEWSERHLGQPYDTDGAFAASGYCDDALLAALLADPYFALPPPKSTGRGYFHLGWLQQRFPGLSRLAPADVQATLAELTVRSVAADLVRYAPTTRRMLVCGGGARNAYLMRRLAELLPRCTVHPSDDYGLDSGWIEATAFAWLAVRTLAGQPGNLPGVTGASRLAVLGGIYRP